MRFFNFNCFLSKIIRRHEAATCIQRKIRGIIARKKVRLYKEKLQGINR